MKIISTKIGAATIVILLILPLALNATQAKLTVKYTPKGSVLRHIPLPKIPDCNVLQNRLNKAEQNIYYMQEGAPMPLASESSQTKTAVPQTAQDFSQTNIQVEGVDEADIVKNDGKYIYLVKGRGVRIIDAYPASNLKEIAKIEDDSDGNFTAQELYVDGDRLVIIGNTYHTYSTNYPFRWGGGVTQVAIFNIADKNNIQEERTLEFESNYVTSRRINDRLYMVMQQYASYYPGHNAIQQVPQNIVPQMIDSSTGKSENIAPCSDIAFFPGYAQPNFLILASIPVTQSRGYVERKMYLGSTDNVYVSQNNLYLAMTTYPQYDFWGGIVPKRVFESSVIYKFQLKNDGTIEYKTAGEVPGTVLNQFSMDEHNGNFRIATTKGNVWSSDATQSTNNIYVLDANMDRLGAVEDIAPGERIYSTRFLAERAYMVTFKQIDPLFVIGLSDPNNPTVLGKLKIPGFSDYLHPYDQNHIIGFGKETEESKESNFAWVQGMKIALFDVSDVNNPKQQFAQVIGDRGTDSELLRNHKALLFDKSKNLLAFPVSVYEISDAIKNNPEEAGFAYGEETFQGLYVYDLSLQNGFQLRGKITHHTDEEILKSGYQFGESSNDISRGLFMDDFLYTISQNKVKANGLTDLNEIKTIELEEASTL